MSREKLKGKDYFDNYLIAYCNYILRGFEMINTGKV